MIESKITTKREQNKLKKLKRIRKRITRKDTGLTFKRTYLITIRRRYDELSVRRKYESSTKL